MSSGGPVITLADIPEFMEVTDDGYRYWCLRHAGVEVMIEHRPHYCDRGHYYAKIFGVYNIDGQDMFPRYYMRLETAMDEMRRFLLWRLYKERA